MSHRFKEMRKQAETLIGQTITVHHVEGWSCHGVLHSVNHEGIYLMNAQMIEQMSSSVEKPTLKHTLQQNDGVDASHVFFPFFFVPFAALAGFAAGSAVARPPYYYPYPGYGYGYGHGPYGPHPGGPAGPAGPGGYGNYGYPGQRPE